MAGITFTVEIDEAALAESLADMVDRMERPIGFYKGVGEYLTNVAIPRNFAAETSPDGTPWASLRPATFKRREKNGISSTKILDATSTMRSGINARPEADNVRVGSPAVQAAVMQFGAAQGAFGAFIGKDKLGRDHFHHMPWGDIPARPFLGLSTDDEAEIIRIAEDWLAVE